MKVMVILSVEECLNEIKPFVKDIIFDLKNLILENSINDSN